MKLYFVKLPEFLRSRLIAKPAPIKTAERPQEPQPEKEPEQPRNN